MKISMKKTLNYLAVFIVFSGAWSYDVQFFAEFRLLYAIIMICLFFWLSRTKAVYFHKGFLLLFSVIAAVSCFAVFGGNNTAPFLIKQLIGIFFNAFAFYLLIKINNRDLRGLFKIYLRLAFIVALIGIIQEASYLLKFRPGYDYSGILPLWNLAIAGDLRFLRVNSILPECFFFSSVIMPAFFVSLASFMKDTYQFQKKWKCVVIIVSFFLSLSIIAYVGAIFVLLLLLYNNRKFRYVAACAVLIWGLAYLSYNNVNQMRAKIDNAVDVISGKSRLEDANLSVYGFVSNALVTYVTLKDNPFFGHGLGSHQVSYEKYIFGEKVVPMSVHRIGLCKGDAGSLFLRLLSETGLFGFIAFFFFIIKFYIPRWKDETGYLWLINNAVLSMCFVKLLKAGNYFVDGFFFFFWLYYFSKLELKAGSRKTAEVIARHELKGSEAC